MAKTDNIHSTEKLLNLIRQGSQSEPTQDNVLIGEAPPKKINKIVAPVSFKKRATIGVDIGHTYIRLAKINQADKEPELLDFIHVPLKSNINVSDAQFQRVLKQTLVQFCENPSNFDIWGAIQSANVETRSIRIPKVPRKQIANAVFWTFTKKVPFNENEEILDYEIIGEVSEGGVKKIEVMAFKAPKAEINDIKSAFHNIGYTLKGISIVPFALQNLFRSGAIGHHEKDTCCLFIGRDWSRIAIFNKGNLVISRGIKAGMRSMVEAINLSIFKGHPYDDQTGTQPLEHNDGQETQTETIHPESQKLFFRFIGINTATESGPQKNGLKYNNQQIFQMILPAIERLVRQVERTFEHYALNFNSDGVQRIYISGQITANKMAMDYIGKQLDLPIEVMNPFPANTPFTRHIQIPTSANQRESFVPSIGLALANNNITPNFLYTHNDKNEYEAVRRNNMRILTACMVALLMLIGLFSWQEKRLDSRSAQVEQLNTKLFTYNPPADKEMLLTLYARTKDKRKTLQQVVGRYIPVAVVTELSKITPPHIRLINISARFNDLGTGSGSTATNQLSIDGIVFGDAAGFEAALTSFLLNLKNSPLFDKPAVQLKQVEYYQSSEVLRFKAKLNII